MLVHGQEARNLSCALWRLRLVHIWCGLMFCDDIVCVLWTLDVILVYACMYHVQQPYNPSNNNQRVTNRKDATHIQN